jgi:predicted ArsR family transcriptional regulator
MSQTYDVFGALVEEPAHYPDTPGYRRRETSKAAADAIAPRAVRLRDLVLAEIKKRPGTADEIAERLRQTVLAVRPRTTELAKLGLIADAGIRRSNVSGRSAIVWRPA